MSEAVLLLLLRCDKIAAVVRGIIGVDATDMATALPCSKEVASNGSIGGGRCMFKPFSRWSSKLCSWSNSSSGVDGMAYGKCLISDSIVGEIAESVDGRDRYLSFTSSVFPAAI